MVLKGFGETLRKVKDKIANAIFLDKKIIDEISKELKYALIEADVDLELVGDIINRIKEEAKNEKIKDIEKKDHLIKIIYDEIVKILGSGEQELRVTKKQGQKIMFIGLYGTGKTTTIAKMANYYSKRGLKCCLLGLDVHRPAAPEQLEQLGEKINLPVFVDKEEKIALNIWKKYKKKTEEYDLCFIDTAGRHSLDLDLVREIKKIEKTILPDYVLLVLAADIGQAAKIQIEEFRKACPIQGIIITRMDSTAKGGGALTASYLTKTSVYFIGTGEHLPDFEKFSSERFVSRLLGLGDLTTLMEKVETAVGQNKKQIKKDSFTMFDMKEQLKSMSQVGSLGKITEMIPGISALKEKFKDSAFDDQEKKVKRWNYAIDSMTNEERNHPEIIEKQTTRISRISKGSGVPSSNIRELLTQYNLIKNFANSENQIDMEDLQKGKLPSGISRKQLMKLAKKYRKKI